MECKCKQWIKNIEIINAPYALHLMAVGEYKGEPFTYCPWCGLLLQVNEK